MNRIIRTLCRAISISDDKTFILNNYLIERDNMRYPVLSCTAYDCNATHSAYRM